MCICVQYKHTRYIHRDDDCIGDGYDDAADDDDDDEIDDDEGDDGHGNQINYYSGDLLLFLKYYIYSSIK